MGDLGIVLQIFRFLLMIFKLIFKVIVFLGLYWFIIALSPGLLFEIVTGRGSIDIMPLAAFMNVLLAVACVLAPLTALQNIIRTMKKDRSYSLLQAVTKWQGEKKGIQSKLSGDRVKLKSVRKISGVVFGKKNGKYVTMPESADGHILVIGGTGSGKSTSFSIPTLISWKERVFAIDIKGELYEKTKSTRNRANTKVFNPTDRNAFGYDPFYMLRHTDDISGEARSLALSICPLPLEIKEPFWIKSAQNMLTGFIVYLFNFGLNFSESMRIIKSKPVMVLIAEIMESGDEKAIAEVSQFDGMDEKTLSGVFSELSNHITVFATSDDLQFALSGRSNCITPEDLEGGYDIYCCIPEHKLEQWKDLLGMMCNQFLKAFERRPEGNTTPILFLIDEFPRLGKIEIVCTGLATLRSKKIHIALIVQSKSQLNAVYGDDVSEVIADNCSYKSILSASGFKTQEWCSRLVGTYEQRKTSSNYNADIIGLGKGQGTSTTTEEKRIIKPEEFAYLEDVVCLFPNGYRRIEKIKYWEDKAFAGV